MWPLSGEVKDHFVPGSSTEYEDLDEDGGEVHVTKALYLRERRAKDPEGGREDEDEDGWVDVGWRRRGSERQYPGWGKMVSEMLAW